MEQDRQKRSYRINIFLFARVIEKVITYALSKVLEYRDKIEKAQKNKKCKSLPSCIRRFYSAIGLPYIYTI
jgi:hypothetical protein